MSMRSKLQLVPHASHCASWIWLHTSWLIGWLSRVFLAAGTCLLVMFIQVVGYFIRTASHKAVERSTLVKYGQVCVLCPFLICWSFFSLIVRPKYVSPQLVADSSNFQKMSIQNAVGQSSPSAGKLLGGNDLSEVGEFGDCKYVLRHHSSCWNLHRLILYGLDDWRLFPGEKLQKMFW